MKKLILVFVSAITGSVLTILLLGIPPPARAGGGAPTCSSKNGDVNADGKLDLADAVTTLGHLFLGNPTELVPNCYPPELTARIQELETQLADCRAGISAGLPDTGAWECSELLGGDWRLFPCSEATCAGQDAQHATGCPSEGRFVDNGDGTVNDTCTGLMWQKDTADVNGDGQSTETDRIDWCIALALCENLSLAGHDDWRLPNVRELQSIADYSRSFYPAIHDVFGAFPSWYWSSTSYAHDPVRSWYVNFDDGFVFRERKSFTSLYVRAVRSGP